jgi:pyridoxine kinase
MEYKRILTIQDISCVGQCSLTVALPILSACGIETAILPSAVLSTHTAGFSGFTFRDLTDDMPAIKEHWQKEGIKFDGIYTGYLGSTKQIGYHHANVLMKC